MRCIVCCIDHPPEHIGHHESWDAWFCSPECYIQKNPSERLKWWHPISQGWSLGWSVSTMESIAALFSNSLEALGDTEISLAMDSMGSPSGSLLGHEPTA